MDDQDRRKLWRAYWTEVDRVREDHRQRVDALWHQWESADPWSRPLAPRMAPGPARPPLPAALAGLTCGAKTRAGTPCKLTDIYLNGRCKFHGGLSTGPRTAKGKRKSARNWRRRSIFKKDPG